MQMRDEQRAKQLHYEVMGIALAIRGHAGNSGLFQELDAALSGPDWTKLDIIQRAFDQLPGHRQELIMSEMGNADQIGRSIAQFERTLRNMMTMQSTRSA